jgi:glutamyl-tRNA synthetase
MDIEKSILKYALENAVKFEGKAQAGAIIGKLLAEDPSIRTKMGEISKLISKVILDLNKKSVEEQKNMLLKIEPDHFEKEKEEKEKRKEQRSELPELEKAEMGKVVTRIPPEPSKYPHFGHALSFLINYMYAIKYNGLCILRYEDTNPEK